MPVARSEMVQRVRRILNDTPYETYITAAITGGATTVPVPNGTKFAEGVIVEFQDDGEQVLVLSVAGNNLTVKRGHNGTTAAGHSANTPILLNPVFQYVQITRTVDMVLSCLWPYAWKASTSNITPSATTTWYQLPADCIDLVAVRQVYGTAADKIAFYGDAGSGLPVRFERNLPTAIVATGIGISFPAGVADDSNQILVTYRAKITNAVSGGSYTDISDGILAEAIVYGACARLVSSREVPRVTDEDITMGDSSVQPGAKLQAAAWYEDMYRRLLNQYHDELLRVSAPMRIWGR